MQNKEDRRKELLRYVRFSAEDAARIRPLLEVARPHFSRIAAEFYERIREHEDAHAVLKDGPQVSRLQRAMVGFLERLLGGVYDDAYFAWIAEIGRVHVRIGVPQRYVLAAMANLRATLAELAARTLGTGTGPFIAALGRLTELNLAIMVDAHCDDFAARLERAHGLHAAATRAERNYQTAVELSHAMVVGVDRKGRIATFNREAEHVTGYGREEAIGRPFGEVMLAGDAETLPTLEGVLGREGETASVEAPLTTRAGRARVVRWRLSGVAAPGADAASDDEAAAFGFGFDVTDEQQALEHARRQEKLASVGVLAAGLAHEIRNPLNGAQLHLAFLDRTLRKGGEPTGRDAEMLEAVGVVRDEIKRLAALVTEFLEFARPKKLDRKPTSLRALAERVGQLVRPQAEAAGVEMKYDMPMSDVVSSVDAGKIEQLLLNIVQNAVEAVAPQGGGTVTVRLRRRPRAAVLEVEDDGPGLPEHGAPVFDAFYSTKPQGTGLGLAIAMRVVTDHGGTIDVASRPGRTCFTVVLPLQPDGEPA